MAHAEITNSSNRTFTDFSCNEQDLVIDEGIGNSPETLGTCSPISQHDDSSSESKMLKSDSFLGQPADHTDIAEEVEIETSPMSPNEVMNEMANSSLSDDISNEMSNPDSVLMLNATEYEDISEEEEGHDHESFDEDNFPMELVSLLTPQSTLIEEDSGIGTGSSSTSCSSIIMDLHIQAPVVKSIPVSTIRWAPKIEVEERLPHEAPGATDEDEAKMGMEEDTDDDIIFLGFVPGQPCQPVPCFLPCCHNVMVNPVIPNPIRHQTHSGFKVNLYPQPIPRQPTLFPEPPESEWVLANVYHLDPLDGILRYKCRSCDGVVEQKSFRSRFQLYTQDLRHQCSQCEKKYFTKKQLQLHLYRHRERRLPCPHCDRRFLTKSELQNHINTHTQRKSFGCPVCSAAFAHSSRYYSHIRNFHKKYDCEECFLKVCGMASANPGSSHNPS